MTTTFRCKVTDVQANAVRERIGKTGLGVHYQEEQHGAELVLIVKCRTEHAHAIKEILDGAGLDTNID